MRELYESLLKRIHRIDFDELWAGFQPCRFALYTKTTIWFENNEVPWNESFIGNTTIFFEGEHIAIWNLEGVSLDSLDLDELCAYIIHEMFHAYQMSHNEKRYPDDLQTLLYPDEETNFVYKYEENKILKAAFEATVIEDKKKLLNQFFSIRKVREQQIGEAIQCEYLTETAEGMAFFVQCKALKQMSEKKYLTETRKYIEMIGAGGKLLFDIRQISYYVGAIFLITAQDAGLSIEHQIGKIKTPVFQMLADQITPVKMNEISNPQIGSILSEVMKDRKREIEESTRKSKYWMKGDYYISGYDPMNMIRYEDMILCRHFIRLTNIADNKSLMLYGKTVLLMKQRSRNMVHGYKTGIQ